MAFFGQYWYEAREIGGLMIPTMTSTFLESSMVVVDVIMLGHLGKGHVAAYAIGNGFFNILWYFIEGFLTAQDTLCSNAYGSGDPKAVRYWSYVALCSVIILCVLATCIIFFTEMILGSWFFITFHMKTKACVHVYILTPALWFMAFYRIVQKYLQSRGIMGPSVQASFIGNAVNIGLNYLFIFQFGWGFAGCAGATTVTRFLMLLLIYRHIKKSSAAFGIYAELGELVRDTPVEGAAHGAAALLDNAQQALEKVPVKKARRTLGQTVKGLGRRLGVGGVSAAGKYIEGDDDDDDNNQRGDIEMPSSSFIGRLWGGSKAGKRNKKGYDRRKNSASVMPFQGSSHSVASSNEGEGEGQGGSDDSDDTEIKVRVPRDRMPPPPDVSPLSGFAATLHAKREAEEAEEDLDESRSSYVDEVDGRMSPERLHEEGDVEENDEQGDEESEEEEEEEESEEDDWRVRRPLLAAAFSSSEEPEDPNSPFVVGSLNIRGPRTMFIVRFLRFCALGIPGALLLGMENWIFVAIVMFIARMGSVPLAATQILIVFNEMVYLTIPFSIAVACTQRIGSALGANNVDKAKAACVSSYALGMLLVGGAAGIVYILPLYLAYIFTYDGDVVYRVATLSSLAAIFQLMYGLVGLSQGVLKAMGRQSEVAGFTLACLYILGLPLAYFWGMWVRPTYGLYGFWVGITLGMGTLAAILGLVVWISDWHREARRANVRLSRERQGFRAVATGDYADVFGGANRNDGGDGEGWLTGPRVGRPMLGSRASGGFSWGYANLQEEMDEVEQVDFLLVQQQGDRDHGA